jgi:tyrosyl-DNA phosphodiesterase 2
MMLLSKDRFNSSSLGPVWRVKYPSRFGRDALCCDASVPSSPSNETSQLRLINVHLDSHPLQPSKRSEQLSIVSGLLREAGRGLVAGDFNAVLPRDDTLIQDNGLVDAWVELHNSQPGFTWGVDGKQRFPARRLDKVAMLRLRSVGIEILHPDNITGQDGRVVP